MDKNINWNFKPVNTWGKQRHTWVGEGVFFMPDLWYAPGKERTKVKVRVQILLFNPFDRKIKDDAGH
jgi:hypothetical protein